VEGLVQEKAARGGGKIKGTKRREEETAGKAKKGLSTSKHMKKTKGNPKNKWGRGRGGSQVV